MNKKTLKKDIKRIGRKEDFFYILYDREDANRILGTLNEDASLPPLTDDEWLFVLRCMNTDDAVWQETYNAMYHYLDRVVEKRAE